MRKVFLLLSIMCSAVSIYPAAFNDTGIAGVICPAADCNENSSNGNDNQSTKKFFIEDEKMKVREFVGAAKKGDLKVVQNFIVQGVDVNAVGERGFTALQDASWGGYPKVVEILLAAKAHIDTIRFGNTALMKAAMFVHTVEHNEVVKLLLAGNADPNIITEDGTTALKNAAYHGGVAAVQALIANKADVNLGKGGWGVPLWLTVQRGYNAEHAEIVKLLLDCKANQDFVGKDGKTVLMAARDDTGVIHSMIVEARRRQLIRRCPVVKFIMPREFEILDSDKSILPFEIMELIFGQLDASTIASMRLACSAFLFLSQSKFNVIKSERFVRLKKILIHNIEREIKWFKGFDTRKIRIEAALEDECEKVKKLDLLVVSVAGV